MAEHSVEKYRFKVLGGAANTLSEESKDDPQVVIAAPKEESKPIKSAPIIDESSAFIEQLLKKSDDLSTNIIKLQMQIEKQEVDFSKRMETEVKRESEDAFAKGYEKAKQEYELATQELQSRYEDAIKNLDDARDEIPKYLKKIEAELSETALEIAKEVIIKEVSIASSDIALALAAKLIGELNDAKSIEIKVNPKDFALLQKKYENLENIKVLSDNAIAQGGVVVLSEIGNLDANLVNRIEKVKNLIDK